MVERGYKRTKAFRFAKEVTVDEGEPIVVEVDFLVPKGSLPRPRTRAVPGFRAIEAEGASLALESTESARVDGSMPDGPRHSVDLRVASVEGFIVMKAFALRGRLKEKDAYDIVFCLQHWPGGAAAIADRLRPFSGRADVREAMRILAVHFASPGHLGAQSVAVFLDPGDPDERAFVARDAFERVQALLRELGFGENA
jgi:Nucleotidyl transferase AbiEii toxin, Type IV TA system